MAVLSVSITKSRSQVRNTVLKLKNHHCARAEEVVTCFYFLLPIFRALGVCLFRGLTPLRVRDFTTFLSYILVIRIEVMNILTKSKTIFQETATQCEPRNRKF